MKIFKGAKQYVLMAMLFSALHPLHASAQTDQDAIMMSKNYFCGGAMYGHSSWKNYWEGTLKRDNENLGTVSSQMIGIMGNYGIKNNLNVLFNVPWISNRASAGTLHKMNGVQDLSLWVKWMPYSKSIGKGTLSIFGLGGVSLPVSDYTPDFLPLSIGLHSKSFSGRVMVDYELGKFFATGSGTYTYRDNINIDRTAYYTTELHLTNKVEMPDVASFNFRTGYRSGHLIAEAIVSNMTTLGGFDIRRNDMPFASNKMNATAVGAGFKYTFKNIHELSLVGNGNYVVVGRNVGQSTSVSAGVFYAFNVTGANKKPKTDKKN